MTQSIANHYVRRERLPALMAFAVTAVLVTSAFGQQLQESEQDYRAGVFSVKFPYESKYVEILGSKMHYIDQGEGDVFLFLHGNPTSSYLWRNVMRYVAPKGRIVAVDNIGFGKSDKPDVDYTFQTHARYIEEFIDTLKLKNVILVVHDWGSALGLDYAAGHTDNVKGVVFMEAIIPPAFPMKSSHFTELFRRRKTCPSQYTELHSCLRSCQRFFARRIPSETLAVFATGCKESQNFNELKFSQMMDYRSPKGERT